jgi:hypothetical protein
MAATSARLRRLDDSLLLALLVVPTQMAGGGQGAASLQGEHSGLDRHVGCRFFDPWHIMRRRHHTSTEEVTPSVVLSQNWLRVLSINI